MTTAHHGHETEGALPVADLREANEKLLLAGLREQELAAGAHQNAEKLRAVLDNMTEGVTVFDRTGNVILLNPVARTILGITSKTPSPEEYRRLDLRDLEGRPLVFDRDALEPMFDGRRFSDLEVLLSRAGHPARHLVINSSDVRGVNGTIDLVIIVIRDITDLRALEQNREQLAALITHDLRGPLSTIRMAAQLLVEGADNPDRCRSFGVKIERSLVRMERMVGNLLDAQRIRAGKLAPLQLVDCDLVEIALDVIDEQSSVDGPRFMLRGDPTVRGRWAPEELRRALWNLASNGVKYGAPDTPITVEVVRRGDTAFVSVHNEGPPIPVEERALLFEPFVRARSSVALGQRGWGLGLTLVRGCVEAHHGAIHVESEQGSGTTFTMELPLDPDAARVRDQAAAPSEQRASR